MRIIVDADATPSIKLIEDFALSNNIKCILVSDDTRSLNSDYSDVYTVSKGIDSVDLFITKIINKDDIIVTQDYGLAALCLTKGCKSIGPKGLIYTNYNIDNLLLTRYINKKNMHKVKIKGPKKRTREDDLKLIDGLSSLIK